MKVRKKEELASGFAIIDGSKSQKPANLVTRTGNPLENIDLLAKSIKNDVNKSLEEVQGSVSSLKEVAKRITDDFDRMERRMERVSNLQSGMMVFSLGVLLITGIIIGLDYSKWSGEKYEKIVDRIQDVKNGYYTKDESDALIDDFKNCIFFNGLSRCLK